MNSHSPFFLMAINRSRPLTLGYAAKTCARFARLALLGLAIICAGATAALIHADTIGANPTAEPIRLGLARAAAGVIQFEDGGTLIVANNTVSGDEGEVVTDGGRSIQKAFTVRLPGLLTSLKVMTNTISFTANTRNLLADVGGVDVAASPGTTVHTVVTATQESTGAIAIGIDEQVARKTPPTESSLIVPVNLVKGSPKFAPGEVTLCYSALLRERGGVIRSWTLCGTVDFD